MRRVKFKSDVSLNWQALCLSVGADYGEVIAEYTLDGNCFVDILFAGYGQVCWVPICELDEEGGRDEGE